MKITLEAARGFSERVSLVFFVSSEVLDDIIRRVPSSHGKTTFTLNTLRIDLEATSFYPGLPLHLNNREANSEGPDGAI